MTDSQGITVPDSPGHTVNAAVSRSAVKGREKTSEYSSTEEGL